MPRVKRITRPIPSISARTVMLEMNDYSDGMDSHISNDKFPIKDGGTNMWRLAQDARIITLGEYDTRKGVDFYSAPAGETLSDSQVSITGASDKAFTQTTWLAQPFTAGTTGRLTRLDINLKNSAAGTGTPLIEVYTDVSGAPGALIARTSIPASALIGTYAYQTVYFAEPPAIVSATSYWIVARIQPNATNSYAWSGTTTATTAKTSTNSGVSWSATSYSLNFRQYYATDGAIKGLFRGTKSDGTSVTLEAHGTILYKVNDATGAKTAIKTGLSASATDYQFQLANDIIYYVNGFDGYRKWNFTTESQVNATNYTHINHHKGLMFLVPKDNPTRVVFSNFGEYEVFTSTDFTDVPGQKSGDPITALNSLNGYLDIHTLANNYIFSGSDNATFTLDEAPDQNGTYSQQTICQDANLMYYLTDSGVYSSNGSEPRLISLHAYEDVRNLNRDGAVLAVNKNRLYLWYKSAGSAYNDSCYVWNLNYRSGETAALESHDTDAYVSRALSSPSDDFNMLVGSSIVGATYWQELDSNNYTNLGGNINYELDTHYLTYGAPAVEKQVRYWMPRFKAQGGDYAISLDYAYDQRNNWQTLLSLDVQGTGPVWGAFIWGSGTWGTSAEETPDTSLTIPGEHHRIAVRYKHHATRQPHSFLGHTIGASLRRLR